jgi:hypothetical protein
MTVRSRFSSKRTKRSWFSEQEEEEICILNIFLNVSNATPGGRRRDTQVGKLAMKLHGGLDSEVVLNAVDGCALLSDTAY